MTDRVAELLEELTPRYDDRRGDWEQVVADARHGAASRRRVATPARVVVLFAAVAAAALVVLAWPFANENVTLLERARAAIGNGSVLHVTLRGEWGGTTIDLADAARTPVYGEDEIWFDTESGRTHTISRLGGVVQHDALGTQRKPDARLAALGREYRQALEAGTARLAGDDTIDGQPVVWITIHSELLPDVADGKDHDWAQQVAVSKQTFKPVALRETRDGTPGPGTLQRVVDLQMLPRDQANFTPTGPSLEGTAFRQSREMVPLSDAASVLGRTPLWLGERYDDLPLAQVYRDTTSAGHRQRLRLTGTKAAAAIKCSKQHGAGDCFGALGLTSIEVRPDGVFTTRGPIEWAEEQTSLVLVYGTVGGDKPYLTLTESTRTSPFRYTPPPGSIFVSEGGRLGYLQVDGIQVGIEAASEAAIVTAAQALTPMR